ncbi:hypothetical protein H4I95_01926 [Botrytis cinerea]
MASADNANPTILNVSEISRRREKRKVRDYSAKKHGIQSILMAKPSDALDPFYMSDFSDEDSDDSGLEPIDEQEIYDLIAPISDPEHPLSLESLGVVKLEDVHLASPPDLTNPQHSTVIGLGVRVRLEQALPPGYRVEVKIKKDTHSQADEVNKQLADKERVAAALENDNLMNLLRKMMKPALMADDIITTETRFL